MNPDQNPIGHTSETYAGHDVVDPDGQTIGKVSDVIYNDDELAPTWLVVDIGLLKSGHYAPVDGSYVNDDGRLVVPYDKQYVKQAPKASGDHVVDRSLEAELVEHYGAPAV